jgi:hypothetical protein
LSVSLEKSQEVRIVCSLSFGSLCILTMSAWSGKAVVAQCEVWTIFKQGKEGEAANYRPVSLTCVLGKVMEKAMRDHMVAHLIKNSLIRSGQHGSQQGRSTTTNLLEYLERLTEMLDKFLIYHQCVCFCYGVTRSS